MFRQKNLKTKLNKSQINTKSVSSLHRTTMSSGKEHNSVSSMIMVQNLFSKLTKFAVYKTIEASELQRKKKHSREEVKNGFSDHHLICFGLFGFIKHKHKNEEKRDRSVLFIFQKPTSLSISKCHAMFS